MYPYNQNWDAAQARGEEPLVLAWFQSRMGLRVYGKHAPTPASMHNTTGMITYNGGAAIGSDVVFGGLHVVFDSGARVLRFGAITESLGSDRDQILLGLQGAEIGSVTITLDNADGYVSDVIAQESFLGQMFTLRIGYPSLSYADWRACVCGMVVDQTLTPTTCEIVVNALTPNLDASYAMPRASRYSRPQNGTDILPMPYGNLSEGAAADVWKCPCVDTANRVYCVSARPILPVASGNAVRVYVDGVLATSGYTLTTSGNYESKGNIAYLTFASAPSGDVTVAGCGIVNGAGQLLSSPLDILADILTQAGAAMTWNAAALAAAQRVVAARGYVAAGVLISDQSLAALLTSVMASFLGDWWLNADGELVVCFSAGATNQYNIAAFLTEADSMDVSVKQSVSNLCNQAAAYYAPRFTTRDQRTTTGASLDAFDGYHDGAAYRDAQSQAAYGARKVEFSWHWLRRAATAATLQAQIVALFAAPVRVLMLTAPHWRHVGVERGDYVVASCAALRDEAGQPLRNQIWRVLEVRRDFDACSMSYVLQDTGGYYPEPPQQYDGALTVGGYLGRVRDARQLT